MFNVFTLFMQPKANQPTWNVIHLLALSLQKKHIFIGLLGWAADFSVQSINLV